MMPARGRRPASRSTYAQAKKGMEMTIETANRATLEKELREFIARCHEALTHQSQGHPEPFLELWSRADDVTVMAAVGGSETGFGQVSTLLSWASKQQSFESWSAVNIATVVGTDLALTVELEHYGYHADGEDKEM